MDVHGVVVNTILSFEGPFTYHQLIEKLIKDAKMDLSERETYSRVSSKIQEIFEQSSIKVIPFTRPVKYFVDGNI